MYHVDNVSSLFFRPATGWDSHRSRRLPSKLRNLPGPDAIHWRSRISVYLSMWCQQPQDNITIIYLPNICVCVYIYIIYDICQIVRYALEKTIQYTMSKPIATSSDLELAPHEKQLTRYFFGEGFLLISSPKPTNIAAITKPGVYVPPALSVVWLYFADLVLPALATLPRESTHPFPLRIQVETTEIETGSSIKMMFQ